MIKLGRICYVNMAPVYYRLQADVEEVMGVPTELARKLLAGEVDVAAIPSIEFARHAEELEMLPRLCVASDGAVDSIQLVSTIAPERLRRIAVTPESATSVALAKVLFPQAEQVSLGEPAPAKLLDRRRGAEQRLRGSDAALRPRPALARAHRAADGLRALGLSERATTGMAELEEALLSSVQGRPRRARAAGSGGERVLRLPGRLPRPLLREAALRLRAARA